jgi:hypothetical protein
MVRCCRPGLRRRPLVPMGASKPAPSLQPVPTSTTPWPHRTRLFGPCRTCSLDAAPHIISCGRRTASACAAHARMHPCCADMPAAVTAEPCAPMEFVGGPMGAWPRPGRHMHLCSPLTSLSANTSVPPAAQRVDRCSSQLDSCTAVDRRRAAIESPGRGVAARPRARYTPLPIPAWFRRLASHIIHHISHTAAARRDAADPRRRA